MKNKNRNQYIFKGEASINWDRIIALAAPWVATSFASIFVANGDVVAGVALLSTISNYVVIRYWR